MHSLWPHDKNWKPLMYVKIEIIVWSMGVNIVFLFRSGSIKLIKKKKALHFIVIIIVCDRSLLLLIFNRSTDDIGGGGLEIINTHFVKL